MSPESRDDWRANILKFWFGLSHDDWWRGGPELDHLQGKVFVDYLSPLKREMVRKRLEKQRRDRVQDPVREHAL